MPTVIVRFIDDPGDANHGKIKVTTTATTPAGTHKLGIVGPGSLSVKAFPISVDGTGLLYIQYVDIPVVNSGEFLTGDYIFTVVIADTVNFNEVATYRWCPDPDKELDTSIVVDCFSRAMVVTDNTQYPTGTLTRLTTIDTPRVLDTDDVADFSSSEDQVITSLVRSNGIAYYNVTYGVTVEAKIEVSDVASYAAWDLGYIKAFTDYQESVLIECGTDFCSLISCIDSKFQALINEACRSGGIRNMTKQNADLLTLLQTNVAMYGYWLQCRDSDKTLFYYNQIKSLVDDCGCLLPTGPTPIPESAIVYLNGDSAYTVWLSAGNSGSVDDFLNELYPIGAWIEVDGADFDSGYTQDATYKLRYRLTKAHMEMLGRYSVVSTEASGFVLLESSFNPAAIEVEAAFNIYNIDKGGIQVGQLYKDGSEWKVRYGSQYDDTENQFVQGMVPLVGNASVDVLPTTITYPEFTAWVEFPGGAYLNGYIGQVGNELEWRTDGRFMYFRGRIDAVGAASTGFDVFDASYFTGLGLNLVEGSSAAVFETAANGDQANPVGYISVVSGTLRLFSAPLATDEGDALVIAGKIDLE